MDELDFRLDPRQLSRMRTVAVVLVPIGVLLSLAALLWGWPWAPAAFALTFGVLSGVAYLGQRTAGTHVDDWGIRARLIFGRVREYPWADIDKVSVQPRPRGQIVVVSPRIGEAFALAAPVHTSMFPDPGFDAKARRIRSAAAHGGSTTSPVTDGG